MTPQDYQRALMTEASRAARLNLADKHKADCRDARAEGYRAGLVEAARMAEEMAEENDDFGPVWAPESRRVLGVIVRRLFAKAEET